MKSSSSTPSLQVLFNFFLIEYSSPEITPVAVRMSSVWRGYHQGVRELPGHLCTDNKLGPISICHTKGGETWPWIAVEIPQSIVRKVKIVNRGDCCGDRTKNVKVWVGNYLPTTTDTEYSQVILLTKLYHINCSGSSYWDICGTWDQWSSDRGHLSKWI